MVSIHKGEIHYGIFKTVHGKVWSHSFHHSSLIPSLLPLPQSPSSPSLISVTKTIFMACCMEEKTGQMAWTKVQFLEWFWLEITSLPAQHTVRRASFIPSPTQQRTQLNTLTHFFPALSRCTQLSHFPIYFKNCH